MCWRTLESLVVGWFELPLSQTKALSWLRSQPTQTQTVRDSEVPAISKRIDDDISLLFKTNARLTVSVFFIQTVEKNTTKKRGCPPIKSYYPYKQV